MATTIRIKRRISGGASGAPSTLKTTEMAYNETDDIMYVGFGDDGSGNATSIKVLSGLGAFLALAGTQTITGAKTFTISPIVPTPTAADNSTKAASTAFVQTELTSYAPKASPALTGTPTAPTASVGTNTTQIATTAFVIAELAAGIAANDAQVLKGGIDASTNPNYPAADAGWTYRITVAGKIGGASGPNVEAGDMIICFVDGTAAGNHATVGANWLIIQTNIDGAVTLTGTQTLTNKTMSGSSNTFSNIPNTAITGLGTMSTQNASAVNITGGTIDGVTLDGGTF